MELHLRALASIEAAILHALLALNNSPSVCSNQPQALNTAKATISTLAQQQRNLEQRRRANLAFSGQTLVGDNLNVLQASGGGGAWDGLGVRGGLAGDSRLPAAASPSLQPGMGWLAVTVQKSASSPFSAVQEAVESIVAAFILPARVSCPCAPILQFRTGPSHIHMMAVPATLPCALHAAVLGIACSPLPAVLCPHTQDLKLLQSISSKMPPLTLPRHLPSRVPRICAPSLLCPQDLKSLQSIKSKMAGGAARQSMALHAGGGPLGPSLLSRTSTPNVDLIKVCWGAALMLLEGWKAVGMRPLLVLCVRFSCAGQRRLLATV